MKIIIDQSIDCPTHSLGTFRKEYETDAVPVEGMYFEDSAWKEPKKITAVTLSLDEGYYYIGIASERINENNYERHRKMYEGHGWKCL